MISCPNCSKKLNETFEYCNECGSSLKGGDVGDFKTTIVNVFSHPDGFLYLYAKNGHQIIVKAGSLDNLKENVLRQNLFWIAHDSKAVRKATGKVKKIDNPFLRISSMAKPSECIEKASGVKLKSSEVKVNRKNVFRSKVKRNPDVRKAITVEDLPTEYGILGVSKEYVNGRISWVYQSTESKGKIRENTLTRLKDSVESRNLPWHVCDEEKSIRSFRDDMIEIERRDGEIRAKNARNVSIDIKAKSEIRKMYSNAVPAGENNTELEKFFR